MTVDEIVEKLRAVAAVGAEPDGWRRRLGGTGLTVRYELLDEAGAIRPYVMRVGPGQAEIGPAPAGDGPPEDIAIRTDPRTLDRVLTGELSGRDAIVGGLLDLRKQPSMPKLLLMRSLFTRYQKAQRRAEVGSDG